MWLKRFLAIIIFINLLKVEFAIIVEKQEHEFAHMVKYFLLKKLGINADDIPSQIKHPSVPSYMNYLYTLMDTLDMQESLHGYLTQDLNSDQTIVAVNPKTKRKHATILQASFDVSKEKMGEFNGCEIVFQVKKQYRSSSFISVPLKICDTDRGYCFDTIYKIKKMNSSSKTWCSSDLTPLLWLWKNDSSGINTINMTFELLENNSNNREIFISSNYKELQLILISNPIAYNYSINSQMSHLNVHSERQKRSVPDLEQQQQRPSSDCSLHDWIVDFTILEWDHFIVRPKTFKSNYCSGQCREPLTDSQNATNHAYIRSVFRSMLPEQYTQFLPPVTCVATGLSPLTLLIRKDNHTKISRNREMTVERCGCM